jgi:DNA-binding NarL/FixJ family response regulator
VRIVFADDSDIVRSLIKRRLTELEPAWEIHEANTGKAAYEATLFLKPDLVLLDINLPDLHGHLVAQKIRKSLPTVKIVLCSLSDPSEVSEEMKASGADAYISKVVTIQEFHETLSALLNDKAQNA